MSRSAPIQDGAKREVLMLWILLTANGDYHPTPNTVASTLLGKIQKAVAKELGEKTWTFPFYDKDKKDYPLKFIQAAIKTEKTDGPYSLVADDFRKAPNPPWSGTGAHPTVAELVAMLGITKGLATDTKKKARGRKGKR